MSWKECSTVNERMKFVIRLESGEKMTDLCKEFGVSRKTGYKIWNRYLEEGPKGLYDRNRRPKHHPATTSKVIENLIIDLKKEKPSWGAPKIKEILTRRHSDIKIPAKSTIHVILDKHGLVKKRRKRRFKASGTHLSIPKQPNDLWCADFKGQFKMGNKEYCYPLTVTDQLSRYLLGCEAMEKIKSDDVIVSFKRIFNEFGLPKAIKTDNGFPFSTRSNFGLSKLSVWWLRLGIKLERIQPGHPEQNGTHERMHLTLKQETTRPAGDNIMHQQEKFEYFENEYNTQRPHEGLGMKMPAEVYVKSSRQYPEHLTELEYPFHDFTRRVNSNGSIKVKGKRYSFPGKVLDYQTLGFKEMDDNLWLVSFMEYDLGYFDFEENKFAPLENPFEYQLDSIKV